jgi:isopentenyl-diphosphate delta-isomerase
MAEPTEISRRKDQHLDLALEQRPAIAERVSPFDRVGLTPCALPELSLDEVSVRTTFLGRPVQAPFLISSMTGGPHRGGAINGNLAEAAGELGIALGVGSQRIALEGAGDRGFSRDLRRLAGDAVLLANIGGAQLARGYGVDEARRAIEMIEADGLIIHLNPLQEAVQPGGDTDWRGVLAGVEVLAAGAGAPLVVKEVGFGISAEVARQLRAAPTGRRSRAAGLPIPPTGRRPQLSRAGACPRPGRFRRCARHALTCA